MSTDACMQPHTIGIYTKGICRVTGMCQETNTCYAIYKEREVSFHHNFSLPVTFFMVHVKKGIFDSLCIPWQRYKHAEKRQPKYQKTDYMIFF